MLRPKRTKRAPARRPFLTEGAPTRNDIRPEGARLRERLDRPLGFGEERRIPPASVLDALAEQSLTAGYSRKRNAICGGCGTMKTAKGRCFCDDDAPAVPRTERKPESACRGCGMRPAYGEGCICRKG